ncbi:helix-turn-helix transcriptional regulator [Paraburkholderia sediminicola]|uniref:helix-turn-helix transcriptional regulator n=1 Tax=Paraburkholderia sediminicola TaxID=458836 RepID=UPI0038B7E11B
MANPQMAEPSGWSQLALDPHEMSELIGLVYEGPLIEVPWHTLLGALRERLAANYATLILRPPSSSSRGLVINSSAVDTSVGTGAYAQHFYALDPFVNLPRDEVVTVHELIGEQRWLTSEIYRFFNKPYDVCYIMGADIHAGPGVECRLRICRPHGAALFSESDKALCKMLLPHLQRAVRILTNLDVTESERRLYAGTVDHLRIGAVVLDESGQVLNKNDAAAEVLAERDGLSVANGLLIGDNVAENRKLQILIQQAMSGCEAAQPGIARGLSVTRGAGRSRLGLLVRTIPLVETSGSKRRPAVVVLIRDPDRKALASTELLQNMFDFTRAEASLVLLLIKGLSLQDAAQAMEIRLNTARSHLRAVFSKTGVTRQTELIQMIFNSVIPFG